MDERITKVAQIIDEVRNGDDGGELQPYMLEAAEKILAHLDREWQARVAGAVELVASSLDWGWCEDHQEHEQTGCEIKLRKALALLRGEAEAHPCPRCAGWETVAASDAPLGRRVDVLIDYWESGRDRSDQASAEMEPGDEWRLQRKRSDYLDWERDVKPIVGGEDVAG